VQNRNGTTEALASVCSSTCSWARIFRSSQAGSFNRSGSFSSSNSSGETLLARAATVPSVTSSTSWAGSIETPASTCSGACEVATTP
jgi:hypothetical protein